MGQLRAVSSLLTRWSSLNGMVTPGILLSPKLVKRRFLQEEDDLAAQHPSTGCDHTHHSKRFSITQLESTQTLIPFLGDIKCIIWAWARCTGVN